LLVVTTLLSLLVVQVVMVVARASCRSPAAYAAIRALPRLAAPVELLLGAGSDSDATMRRREAEAVGATGVGRLGGTVGAQADGAAVAGMGASHGSAAASSWLAPLVDGVSSHTLRGRLLPPPPPVAAATAAAIVSRRAFEQRPTGMQQRVE